MIEKEILFKLFGETAKKILKILKEGGELRYDNQGVEGRTVLNVYEKKKG